MLNKRTKTFLLFTTLLIVLVGIGAVAASDNSTATADTSSASTVQATTVAANTTTDTVQTSTDDSSSDVVKETTTTSNKDTQTNTATTSDNTQATTSDNTQATTVTSTAATSDNTQATTVASAAKTVTSNAQATSIVKQATKQASQITTNTTVSTSATDNKALTTDTVTITPTVKNYTGTTSTDVKTGVVTIKANGNQIGTVNLTAGETSITYQFKQDGFYTITANYNDATNTYVSSSNITNVTVSKATVNIAEPTFNQTGVSSPLYVLNTTTVSTTVTGTTEGAVVFSTKINGTTKTLGTSAIDEHGNAHVDFTVPTAGDYNITATYIDNDTIYAQASSSAVQAFATMPVNVTVNSITGAVLSPTTISVNVTDKNNNNVTKGLVVFYVNGEVIGNATVTNGVATISYTPSAAGIYQINATYNDTTNTYANGTATVNGTATIGKIATTIQANTVTDVINNNTALTAIVTDSVGKVISEGQVIFYENGKPIATVDVANGTATGYHNFTTTGVHNITVNYYDVDVFDSSSTVTTASIVEATTITTIPTVTGNTTVAPVIVVYVTDASGNNVTGGTVYYTITTAKGTVLNESSAAVSNGKVTINNVKFSPSATYYINTTYTNNSVSYGNSTAKGEIIISTTNTTIVVTNTGATTTTNTSITAKVTVNGTTATYPTRGNVTFYYGNTVIGNGTVDNTTGLVTINNINFPTAGEYNITAVYTDVNNKYTTSTNVTTVIVTDTKTTVNTADVSGNTITPTTLNVTVKDGSGNNVTTGTVNFYYNNTLIGTANVVNGTAAINNTFTKAGTYEITANYTDSTNKYANATNKFNAVISTVNTDMNVVGFVTNGNTSSVTLLVTSGNTPVTSGNVTLAFVNGTVIGTATVNADGTVTINGTLPSGLNTLKATYNDTADTYTNSTRDFTISVGNSTYIVMNPVTNTTNTNVAVTANIYNANGALIKQGTVTFVSNGVNQTVNVNPVTGNATATFTYSAAGTYDVIAFYNDGNGAYSASVNTTTATINKIATVVNATAVTGIVYNNTEVTANVVDANGNKVTQGTVYFYENGVIMGNATVSNGVATLKYNFTEAVSGATITVKYTDSANTYADSTNTTTATIAKAYSNVNVTVVNTINSTTSGVKDAVVAMNSTVLNATVVDQAGNIVKTGTVTFIVNGANVGSADINSTTGNALFTYNFTKAGTFNVEVNYNDVSAYASSHNSTTAKVVLMPTNVTIPAINDTTMNNTLITVNVTDANGNAVNTGKVTIYVNGVAIANNVTVVNGIAKTNYNFTSATTGTGANTNITAFFTDDQTAYYNSSVVSGSTITFTNGTVANITKQNVTVTVPDVTGSTASKTNLVATIVDQNGNPVQSGLVYFYDGTTLIGVATVSNGTASYANLFNTTGVYNLTVAYNDIKNTYNDGQTTAKVTIVSGSVVITAPDMNGTTMTSYKVVVNVTDANGNPITSGNITFTDSTGSITVPVTNGTAIAFNGYIVAGNYTVNVTYTDANGMYANANTTFVVSIVKINTTIVVNPVNGTVGDTIAITANVTDANGNPVEAGKVAFKVNGKTLVDANGSTIYGTVVNGVATINYTVPANWARGNTTITAVYGGISTTYNAARATVNSTVTVEKRTANMTVVTDTTAKGGDTITITAIVNDNGTVINGGKVVFKFQGKTILNANGTPMYAAVVNGLASINYTLPLGISAKDYNISAVFGNSAYNRADASTTLTVQKTNTTITVNPATGVSNATTTISGVIKDINGNNVVGTKKVAVKINGVTLKDAAGKVVYVYAQNGTINANVTLPNLKVGTHNLTFVTGDNSAYYGSTGVGTLVINKATATATKATA